MTTRCRLWPVSDAGLKIAADFYNFNMKQHDGKLEAVLFGKMLSERRTEMHRLRHRARRGQPNRGATVGDRHLHRQLALRPLALRQKPLQERQDRHSNAVRHRQQKRRFAAQHSRARRRHD